MAAAKTGNTVTNAAAASAATAPVAARGPVADEKTVRLAYKAFNDRLILFIGDLEKSYRKYPGLGVLKKQIEAFTRLDPARRMPAQRAWPLFAKHQKLIEGRDEKVFTEYDLADLKNRAGLDTRVMWRESSAVNKEAMWQAMEELLEDLLDINDVAPMPPAGADADEAADMFGMGGSGGDTASQKKSRSVAAASASPATAGEKPKKKKRKNRLSGTAKKRKLPRLS